MKWKVKAHNYIKKYRKIGIAKKNNEKSCAIIKL